MLKKIVFRNYQFGSLDTFHYHLCTLKGVFKTKPADLEKVPQIMVLLGISCLSMLNFSQTST